MSLADRSDFTYHVEAVGGEPVLVIKDQNKGGMTVTNNMAAVLDYVEDDTGLDLTGAKIVYRDSRGTYDGVEYRGGGKHVIYSPAKGRRITTEEEAIASVRSGTTGG